MANYVDNRIIAPQHVLDELCSTESGREEIVDFNRIRPLPAELLQIHRGSTRIDGEIVEVWRGEMDNPTRIEDEELDRLMAEHGACSWYDWSWLHWGTKWNAFDSRRESDEELQFCTAWNAPHPIVDELVRRHPHEIIKHAWADDLMGYCGRREFSNRLEVNAIAHDLEVYTPDDVEVYKPGDGALARAIWNGSLDAFQVRSPATCQ